LVARSGPGKISSSSLLAPALAELDAENEPTAGDRPPVEQSSLLLVYDDHIDDAEVAEPFATLADPEVPQRLNGGTADDAAASSHGGQTGPGNRGDWI
jgi:hypothetical protein